MVKIVKERWEKNKDILHEAIKRGIEQANYPEEFLTYENLVSVAFDCIVNDPQEEKLLNTSSIHVIDDGSYQGTLIFLIPYNTYQPGASEYIMAHCYYGSCSGCDTLKFLIADYSWEHKDKDRLAYEILCLCRDILCTAIKPYNNGWRNDPMWEEVDFE